MAKENNKNLLKTLDNLEAQYFKNKYQATENKISMLDTLTPSILLFFSAMSMFYEALFNITVLLSKKTPIPKHAFKMWLKLKYLYLDTKHGTLYYYNSYMCDTNKCLIDEKTSEFRNKMHTMKNILRDLVVSENKELIKSKIQEFSELNKMSTFDKYDDNDLNVNNNNIMYGGD